MSGGLKRQKAKQCSDSGGSGPPTDAVRNRPITPDAHRYSPLWEHRTSVSPSPLLRCEDNVCACVGALCA